MFKMSNSLQCGTIIFQKPAFGRFQMGRVNLKTIKETLLKLHHIMQYQKQGVYQLQYVFFLYFRNIKCIHLLAKPLQKGYVIINYTD